MQQRNASTAALDCCVHVYSAACFKGDGTGLVDQTNNGDYSFLFLLNSNLLSRGSVLARDLRMKFCCFPGCSNDSIKTNLLATTKSEGSVIKAVDPCNWEEKF